MHHFRWLTKLFQVGCEATYSHLYACLEDKTWGKEFNVILQQYAISTCYLPVYCYQRELSLPGHLRTNWT